MDLTGLFSTNDNKIVLVVMDGLGGLPHPEHGKSELETAATPVMDGLANTGELGQLIPIKPGITSGSGPAHLALFGYDPLEFIVGRGVLAALGVGLELREGDVPARINFATVDSNGNLTDRRAGRIPTELNEELIEKLRSIRIDGVEIILKTVKEHRAAIIFRGKDQKLGGKISDTDPQVTGVPPLSPKALDQAAEATVPIVEEFVRKAFELLADQPQANALLLRGFDQYRAIPSMTERYGLRAAAIANYPMYRGLGQLVGMTILETGQTIESEFDTLEREWDNFDFFYLHVKKTDSYGEDGNFEKKVSIIEEVDAQIARLVSLSPSVIAITGDHSTPAVMKSHSWHPVPLLIKSNWNRRVDGETCFCEKSCARGHLSTFESKHLITLLLAHASRLKKFGA